MKYLENFKSENIQSIYDFLEQDADVTNFKRDLIELAAHKKCDLHDLEAEVFQYAELIKEDLKDKIVFVFREDGYLGMFGELTYDEVITIGDHNKLQTGDKVSVYITKFQYKDYNKVIFGTIFREKEWTFFIQNELDGMQPYSLESRDWEQYGRYSYSLSRNDIIRNKDSRVLYGVNCAKKWTSPYFNILPNLVIDNAEIKKLKMTMHFALVI